MRPLFNGTAEETIAWLDSHPEEYEYIYRICDGESLDLLTVEEYRERYNKKEKA